MKTYSDLEGDTSGVVDQVVARRERQREALSGIRHLVAVASGKGGVGKSTVTMGLAQAAQARQRRVAVLDADLNGPSQAVIGGMADRPWVPDESGRLELPRRPDGVGVVSLGSVLGRARPLTFDAKAEGDEQVWRGSREITMFQDLLSAVEWGELDLLLIDLPPGAALTIQFAGLLERARFVLVTLPSALARGVVERSATALADGGQFPVGLIQNMAGYRCPDCGEIQPLFPESAEEHAAPLLGSIPFDPEIAALCDRGWPSDDPAAAPARAHFGPLAERLEEALE